MAEENGCSGSRLIEITESSQITDPCNCWSLSIASFPGGLPLCSLDRICDLWTACFSGQFKGHVCGQENRAGDGQGTRLASVCTSSLNWLTIFLLSFLIKVHVSLHVPKKLKGQCSNSPTDSYWELHFIPTYFILSNQWIHFVQWNIYLDFRVSNGHLCSHQVSITTPQDVGWTRVSFEQGMCKQLVRFAKWIICCIAKSVIVASSPLVSRGQTLFRTEGKGLGHGHGAVYHPALWSAYQSQHSIFRHMTSEVWFTGRFKISVWVEHELEAWEVRWGRSVLSHELKSNRNRNRGCRKVTGLTLAIAIVTSWLDLCD